MLEIILGSVVFVALFIMIIVIYRNKFQFAIIKIDEAENNIDLLLQKKLELVKRCSSIVKKELKLEEFLEELEEEELDKLNHFELNNLLKEQYNSLFQTLDDNEKLFESEALVSIVTEINNNEIELIAAVKFYNDTVVLFNQLIVSFPSNIIRFLFRYKKKEFYNNEKREIYEILKDN